MFHAFVLYVDKFALILRHSSSLTILLCFNVHSAAVGRGMQGCCYCYWRGVLTLRCDPFCANFFLSGIALKNSNCGNVRRKWIAGQCELSPFSNDINVAPSAVLLTEAE